MAFESNSKNGDRGTRTDLAPDEYEQIEVLRIKKLIICYNSVIMEQVIIV